MSLLLYNLPQDSVLYFPQLKKRSKSVLALIELTLSLYTLMHVHLFNTSSVLDFISVTVISFSELIRPALLVTEP